jgi:hypothetical protein
LIDVVVFVEKRDHVVRPHGHVFGNHKAKVIVIELLVKDQIVSQVNS